MIPPWLFKYQGDPEFFEEFVPYKRTMKEFVDDYVFTGCSDSYIMTLARNTRWSKMIVEVESYLKALRKKLKKYKPKS